jgi:hypothetical protein
MDAATEGGSTARSGVWRSRWAAIGAAVAVSLGAGGIFVAQAAPGASESTVVSVAPERILDTRDPVNVGLTGPFVSPISQKLQVTGAVPTTTGVRTVVPTGATGVLLNVTAVSPAANGFISVRPGDATGAPTTSSLNVQAASIVPNAVQVAVPTTGANAGQIDITFDAYGVAGPATDILIDVVGYTTNTGLQQLAAAVDDGPVVKAFNNASDSGALPNPIPAPATVAPTLSMTTTSASRLFIQLSHAVGSPTGCAPGNRLLWIELDGVRIPSSIQVATIGAGITSFTLAGVTDAVVPAGVHQVRPRQACFSGTAATTSYNTFVQGLVAYVADGGTALALESDDISVSVAPCDGREVDGTCIAAP